MAKPEGFVCDSCGTYTEPEYRTTKRTQFIGPFIDGHITHELCPDCAPRPEDLVGYVSTRRRKQTAEEPEPETTIDLSSGIVESGRLFPLVNPQYPTTTAITGHETRGLEPPMQ